jgi:hypothetical protein
MNSGTVIYFCRIDDKKYIISKEASVNEYFYREWKFTTIIDCINYIDEIALLHKIFIGPEI